MALFHSRPYKTSSLHGFSLVELSVVVAIISVVATLGLEVVANFVNRTSNSVSLERLKLVDEATAAFFKTYGRLPCPALKTLAPPSTATNNYGLEDCSIAALVGPTIGGSIVVGAVPFRTLNLPMIYSLDGFGSKFNYVVTKNLTRAGTSVTGQFGYNAGTSAQNGVAGIEVRTGILQTTCAAGNCQVLADPTSITSPGAAYLIFSSGADQRGAVSERGTALKTCANPVATSDQRVDTQNCVFGSNAVRLNMNVGGAASTIPYNVFYDNRVNAGLNRTSYFDDVVVWRPRLQL